MTARIDLLAVVAGDTSCDPSRLLMCVVGVVTRAEAPRIGTSDLSNVCSACRPSLLSPMIGIADEDLLRACGTDAEEDTAARSSCARTFGSVGHAETLGFSIRGAALDPMEAVSGIDIVAAATWAVALMSRILHRSFTWELVKEPDGGTEDPTGFGRDENPTARLTLI